MNPADSGGTWDGHGANVSVEWSGAGDDLSLVVTPVAVSTQAVARAEAAAAGAAGAAAAAAAAPADRAPSAAANDLSDYALVVLPGWNFGRTGTISVDVGRRGGASPPGTVRAVPTGAGAGPGTAVSPITIQPCAENAPLDLTAAQTAALWNGMQRGLGHDGTAQPSPFAAYSLQDAAGTPGRAVAMSSATPAAPEPQPQAEVVAVLAAARAAELKRYAAYGERAEVKAAVQVMQCGYNVQRGVAHDGLWRLGLQPMTACH
jgi:hypothetical protein